PPVIRDEWQKNNKAASTEFLVELVGPQYKGKTDEETASNQVAAWANRIELQRVADDVFITPEESEDDDDDDEPKKKKSKKFKDFKVTRDFYTFIRSQLSDKSKRGGVQGAGLAMRVLDLAVGEIESVTGLTSKAAYEKARELKASNKA